MGERTGQQLGNYRLIRLLGQGGFADVYLAEHIHLNTQAAIKVLSMRLTSDNVEHFRTEARTLAHLIHPHVVRVLDFGVENGTPYLIMDYAPNGSLRQRHPKGSRLPFTTIVDYVKQVAKATTGNAIATYRGSAFLFGLSWSPDSKYIAIGSSNNTVLVVDAVSGSVLNTYSGYSNWVKDVAWSPDGKHIASGSDDGMVLLWDTATGANFYIYNGHSGHINAVGWSPNGKLIASGGDTVPVWQAP